MLDSFLNPLLQFFLVSYSCCFTQCLLYPFKYIKYWFCIPDSSVVQCGADSAGLFVSTHGACFLVFLLISFVCLCVDRKYGGA